jgi:hypothetical protein
VLPRPILFTFAVLLILAVPWGWRLVGLPVKLMAVGYIGFAVGCVALFHADAHDLTGPNAAPIYDYLQTPAWTVVGVFTVVAACVFLGAVLVRIVARQAEGRGTTSAELQLKLPPSTLWLPVACLIAAIVGVGPSTVFRSPAYLYASGPQTLVKISLGTLPLATVIAAVVMFSAQRTVQRVSALLILALIEILQFGQATRSFSLFFALVFVGGWLSGRWTRPQLVVRAIGAAVLALATIGIPLALRAMPEHGLIPSVNYLFTSPGQFFSGDSNPLYNVLIGVPVTLFVWRDQPAIGSHALWTSINPAPGNLTDWPTLLNTLRVNIYEPYPAIGELLNHGWLATIAYSTALGAVLESLMLLASRCRAPWTGAIRLAVTGTAAVLLVRSTQYNLRTETRFVYYLIVGVLAMFVASRLRSDNAASADSADRHQRTRRDAGNVRNRDRQVALSGPTNAHE